MFAKMLPSQSMPCVIIKMENLNYSMVDIDHPNPSTIAFQSTRKDHAKNMKQFAWVLLLSVHKSIGFVVGSMSPLWALIRVVKSNLSLQGKLVLRFLKAILILSFAALIFRSVVNWKGLAHFQTPNFHGWMNSFYAQWCSIRTIYIAYPIQLFSNLCIALFILQSLDRTILCLGWLWIKLRKMQPRIKVRQEHPIPMVLVQIPMCNEHEVHMCLMK